MTVDTQEVFKQRVWAIWPSARITVQSVSQIRDTVWIEVMDERADLLITVQGPAAKALAVALVAVKGANEA